MNITPEYNLNQMVEKVITVDTLRILLARSILYQEYGLFNDNLTILHHLDHTMRAMVIQTETFLCGGDVTEESKVVEYNHEWQVFQTWWDHLKYDLCERRVLSWLPSWWTKSLTVRYQPVKTKESVTVPVKVRRMCPHLEGPRQRSVLPHLHFLVPSQFTTKEEV